MANTFEEDGKIKNNLSDFEELSRNAANINSQLSVWVGKFDALRADVVVNKQAELDVTKTAFVQQLKTTLGL